MSSISLRLDSLRRRLLLSLSAAIVISLALWLFVFHILVRNELYGSFDDSLVAHMQALAAYAVNNPGAEGIAEYMPEFRTQQHQDFFQVWDAEGNVLARSDSSAGRTLPRLAAVKGEPTFYDLELPDGHPGRAAAQNFTVPPGDPRGLIVVATAAEIEPLIALEQRLHLFVLAGSLATVLASVAIASYSVRRSLRPLEALSKSVTELDPADPEARLEIGELPSELAPVANKIQLMMSRLIQALARERRFARNVAHELRTPLAEARMLADVGGLAEDASESRRALVEIGKATQELEQIVDSLLSLSRYESGIEKPELEPVDLRAELDRHIALLEGPAQARGLRIRVDAPAEAWIFSDAALVRRLIANLLGNAVAHCPAGSLVQARIGPDRELVVVNPAPNMKEEDLPRLGERFFRIRSGNGGAHAGLGLSLATAIAGILGLDLSLRLSDRHEFVASLRGLRPLPA